jgi:hypothetical protein
MTKKWILLGVLVLANLYLSQSTAHADNWCQDVLTQGEPSCITFCCDCATGANCYGVSGGGYICADGSSPSVTTSPCGGGGGGCESGCGDGYGNCCDSCCDPTCGGSEEME